MECRIPDMDLEQIAASGQCFRMEPKGRGYCVTARARYLEIEKEEDTGDLFRLSCSQEEWTVSGEDTLIWKRIKARQKLALTRRVGI